MTEDYRSPPGANDGIRILGVEATTYHAGFTTPAQPPRHRKSAYEVNREQALRPKAQVLASLLSRDYKISPPITSDEVLRLIPRGWNIEDSRGRAQEEMASEIMQARTIAPVSQQLPAAMMSPPVCQSSDTARFPLRLKDVAEELEISKSTLKRWHREQKVPPPSGEVPGHRGGRPRWVYDLGWVQRARDQLSQSN